VDTQGVHFDSRWDYTAGLIIGSASASTKMSVIFDLALDSQYSLSWLLEGTGRGPGQHQMTAFQSITITRNGDPGTAFSLVGDFGDTVQRFTLFGSLLGRPTMGDECTLPGPVCPNSAQDSISGFLQSGQYTVTLENSSRSFSYLDIHNNAFGNMEFDLALAEIPLPASIWLFITALSGMGLWSRLLAALHLR
jgi:hypothetical protein